MKYNDKLKGILMAIVLYILSEFGILLWLRMGREAGFGTLNIYEEIAKIVMIGLVPPIAYKVISYKKVDDTANHFFVIAMLLLTFSVATMITIEIALFPSKKICFLIFFIYIFVWLILFYFNKDYYLKLSNSEAKKGKVQKRRVNNIIVARTTLGFLRIAGECERYIFNIILSVAISLGWLILGWFEIQVVRDYILKEE